MRTVEGILDTLRARGELFESAPGAVGLRGELLMLYRALERRLARLARRESDDEWQVPAAISLEVLARADYFASFPQWLTAAAHLSDQPSTLERVATAPDPAEAARSALAPAAAALAPAVCYHVYAALAGRTVASPTLLTAQATCWRHEGAALRPLERGWAFTMREVVCLGTPRDAEAFRVRVLERACRLAKELGLEPAVEEATDPFFAPTARGRALLQRVKGLKHELTLPLDQGRRIAAASANHHESYFGHSFGIRLGTGETAATACVAFGVERWLLAFLVAHGPDAAAWPIPLGSPQLQEV